MRGSDPRDHHERPPVAPPALKACARELRREATFPERLLWGRLRGGRLAGLKFRRQHPVGPFVVDYYCHEARLVVEVDGQSHIGQAEPDRQRTAFLEERAGLRVLRVDNDDVLQHMDSVLAAILQATGIVDDNNQSSPSPSGRGPG